MRQILLVTPSWILFIILFFPFVIASEISFGISFSISILMFWLYIVGNSLKEKILTFKKINLTWYNTSLLYSIAYIIFMELVYKNNIPKILIPFHIVATACIIGAFFYTSKLLVLCEENQPVKVNRCIGTFLLFWFFPIGIWFIHPRIQKVLKS
jgi:hypothetical protein